MHSKIIVHMQYNTFHHSAGTSTLLSGKGSYRGLGGPNERGYMHPRCWLRGEPVGLRGRLLPKEFTPQWVSGASLKRALEKSDLSAKYGDSRSCRGETRREYRKLTSGRRGTRGNILKNRQV